jgi:hypothetical protein
MVMRKRVEKLQPVDPRGASRPAPSSTSSRTATVHDAPEARSVPRSAPSWEEISRRAFEIWEHDGRPAGRDLEHWLQAEAELGGSAPHA